jgi:SAM-dependent methyltransferase
MGIGKETRNTMSIYYHSEEIHNLAVPRVVVPTILQFVKPISVLDVGCGIGTWLKAFEENGVKDIVGIDGDHVDRSKLKIADTQFVPRDLNKPWSLGRKFDLAISLEVAEHLEETTSDLLVKSLTEHADTIIFSAAIPGQGGQNHVNEQWPSYWRNKFEQRGFYFNDGLRAALWNTHGLQWWYVQNLFVVTRNPVPLTVIDVVHPELFKERNTMLHDVYSGEIGVQVSMKILQRAVANWLKKKFK